MNQASLSSLVVPVLPAAGLLQFLCFGPGPLPHHPLEQVGHKVGGFGRYHLFFFYLVLLYQIAVSVQDLFYKIWLNPFTLTGEGGVGGEQFLERHAGGPKGEGQGRSKLRGYPHLPGVIDGVAYSN